MTPTHLSDADLVDLLDRDADPALHGHVASCAACGARLDALRDAWALVEADEAAEPSPLFWGHLSARVSEAVRAEASTARLWIAWRWVLVAAPALLVVLAVALTWGPAGDGTAPPIAPAPAAVAAGPAAEPVLAVADDESWELVTMFSEALAAEERGLPIFEPRLGAAERAAGQLSAEEQQELVRLLAEELGSGPS